MDFKNVKLDDYCFNLDLHRSMFFIDMLKDTYEFTLKGDGIEIFKKIKNGISEPITRKELIYSIQVEMAEKYEYRYFKKKSFSCMSNEQQNIFTLYNQFPCVDSIHKAIDNMVYLEKYLNKKEESDEEVSGEEESDEETTVEEEQVGPQKNHYEKQVEEMISQLKDQQERVLRREAEKILSKQLNEQIRNMDYTRGGDEEEEDEEEQVSPQNWTSVTTRHLSLQQLEEQMTQLHRVLAKRRCTGIMPV